MHTRFALFFLALVVLSVSVPRAAAQAKALAQPSGQPGVRADHALVLGFERIHSAPKADAARGGQLLLGELNCVACHQPDKSLEKQILRRQAPILDGVGSRVRASYLRAFLDNPQAAKPGTIMPDVLASLPEQERKDSTEALVHFLASTGAVKDARPLAKSVAAGQKLFHQVGCVACHGPKQKALTEAASVAPLGELAKKYSIVGLAAFLMDPHKVRPSGRMPGLNLAAQEAQDIAHYLLSDLKVAAAGINLEYAYYEFDQQPNVLPDFKKLKPQGVGKAAGFDVGVARRQANVALKFEGFFKTDNEGFYTFHVTSDDGSKLWIKDSVVVNHDGIHAPATKSGGFRLPKGMHPLTVAVFNAGGGFELDVEVEGPGLARQPLTHWLFPTAKEAPTNPEEKINDLLVVNPDLAKKGRDLFTALGCASCHEMHAPSLAKGGKKQLIASKVKAPTLATVKHDKGCLAEAPAKGTPRFALNAAQKSALTTAIQGLPNIASAVPTAKDAIAQTMTAFNCYACHQRDGKGGVETALNDWFQTPQKEMGDEGRIPPHLDGVGAKLPSAYLKKVLTQGSTDRPYMLTRMPKFGEASVGHVQAAFEEADPVVPLPLSKFSVPEGKVKTEGRFMVGGKAFGCTKCHNFREFKGGGVQGINMTILTERLRREWFVRYVLDPNKFRPGTRMPAIFPLGQSPFPKILDGTATQQTDAIWAYLADGVKAANPYGVGKDPIPLVATTEPILYRNFIKGAGNRAIGVGYPEKLNLAFDANDLRYALLWRNEFMNASRHWTDRGQGAEPPAGDGVVSLPTGPDVAFLAKPDAAWPTAVDKSVYHFRGYRLDDKMRPSFLYEIGAARVEDLMTPEESKEGLHFKRTLTIVGAEDNLWLRIATGSTIKDLGQGWFAVGELKVKVNASAAPVIQTVGNQARLVVPIREKQTKVVIDMMW